MRILRLEMGNETGRLDLHPFVTVVEGLRPDTRARVVAAIRALVGGRDPGVGGLIESEGILIELPSSPARPVGPVALADIALDVDQLPPDPAEALPGLRARLDQVTRQAAIDTARLEEVRTQLDLSVAARLEALRSGGGSERDAAVRFALRQALGAWVATPPTTRVLPAWAEELMEQWEEHRRTGAGCEARLRALDEAVDAASRRLAVARAAQRDAEAATVPVLLTPHEENRLAELATRPLPRGLRRGSRARSDEEQAEIDALLAKVGQPTYAAYMMYRLAPQPVPEQRQAMEAARAATLQAEHDLAAAARSRDDDPELAEYRRRSDALRAVAAQHLGPVLPEDLGQALRAQARELPNPERDEARRRVEVLASRQGLDLPGEADDAALLDAVEGWLHRHPDPGDDVGEVVDQSRLEQALARHRSALERLDGLERRADHSRRLVAALEERVASVGRRPIASAPAILAAVDRLVLEARPSPRSGAVPVVLYGSLSALSPGSVVELLEELELEAERAQILLLTDHPLVARWATEVGPRRALCSRATTRSS